MNADRHTRRGLLRTAGALSVGVASALAGCGGGADGDVVAGAGGSNVFRPEELTIERGDTVTWVFDSGGHNVSAVPEHSDAVSIPDGAAPFASYEGDSKFDTVAVGGTFEHTFETAGEFRYVCIPHVSAGMVGTVVVE